jgi:hypothetical protein
VNEETWVIRTNQRDLRDVPLSQAADPDPEPEPPGYRGTPFSSAL